MVIYHSFFAFKGCIEQAAFVTIAPIFPYLLYNITIKGYNLVTFVDFYFCWDYN